MLWYLARMGTFIGRKKCLVEITPHKIKKIINIVLRFLKEKKRKGNSDIQSKVARKKIKKEQFPSTRRRIPSKGCFPLRPFDSFRTRRRIVFLYCPLNLNC